MRYNGAAYRGQGHRTRRYQCSVGSRSFPVAVAWSRYLGVLNFLPLRCKFDGPPPLLPCCCPQPNIKCAIKKGSVSPQYRAELSQKGSNANVTSSRPLSKQLPLQEAAIDGRTEHARGAGEEIQGQRKHQLGRSFKEGEDFKAKEANMRATSLARWAEDERFNLENAFELQLKRLEVCCATG